MKTTEVQRPLTISPSFDNHFPDKPLRNETGTLETLCGVTPVLVFTRYSPGNIGPTNLRGGTRVRGKPEKGEHPLAPLAASDCSQ